LTAIHCTAAERGGLIKRQVAQLSQRDRAAGWLVMEKVEDWNWETIFTDIIGLYSTNVSYLASKAIDFGEKRKIRATPRSLGQYQSKARMRLSVSD